MDIYMQQAIIESKKASKKGDVPVGVIIVHKNKIIARAYNKKETKQNAIMHAEIIAINKACKKLNTWHLNDCILYTTMEPCMMCCGAIIQSRISKVVYLLKNDQYGCTSLLNNSKIIIEKIKEDEEMKQYIKEFFEKVRKK